MQRAFCETRLASQVSLVVRCPYDRVFTPRQPVALVAMTLANSMILVDQTAVPLAIPHTIAALGGSLPTSQWVLTANALPLTAFMVFAGRLGD
jgi:MFS family permease